jgi:uncharacterized protein (TIGR00661 family)
MARILYGVMGNTHGHVVRSQAIASRLPEHEFHFVGGGTVESLQSTYPVHSVPVLRTVHRNQKVAVLPTIGYLSKGAMSLPKVQKSLLKLIDQWQPDIAICDREFYLPLAARKAGLKCFSINHSRILHACSYDVPASEYISWGLAMLEDQLFFNNTTHNLVISFFHPPLKEGTTDELMPPVLRQAVTQKTASNGDHILVYQTSPTFTKLIAALKKQSRPVIAYGFRKTFSTEGNITFKPYHAESILDDLASCHYAVVNGGHNLICEALYYGKPIFCFPIAKHFEQFINACHIRKLEFGDFSMSQDPIPEMFQEFEQKIEVYRKKVAKESFDGTSKVIQRIQEIIHATHV